MLMSCLCELQVVTNSCLVWPVKVRAIASWLGRSLGLKFILKWNGHRINLDFVVQGLNQEIGTLSVSFKTDL